MSAATDHIEALIANYAHGSSPLTLRETAEQILRAVSGSAVVAECEHCRAAGMPVSACGWGHVRDNPVSELRPCQLCGGRAEYRDVKGGGYRVACTHCGARGAWGDYGFQARDHWNTGLQGFPVSSANAALAERKDQAGGGEEL